LPAPLPRGQRPQIMAAIGGRYRAVGHQGKATNMPVHRLLGGSRRSFLPMPRAVTMSRRPHRRRRELGRRLPLDTVPSNSRLVAVAEGVCVSGPRARPLAMRC
jgi:hypothetical protein